MRMEQQITTNCELLSTPKYHHAAAVTPVNTNNLGLTANPSPDVTQGNGAGASDGRSMVRGLPSHERCQRLCSSMRRRHLPWIAVPVQDWARGLELSVVSMAVVDARTPVLVLVNEVHNSLTSSYVVPFNLS